MSRIGVLGGTFDPVHKGHIALAQAACREFSLDRLILMPAYIQPFKRDRKVSDDGERLEMLELALAEVSDSDAGIPLEISTYEIDKEGVSYSYDTISHLKEEYPTDRIFFVMGSDPLRFNEEKEKINLENWYRAEDLFNLCDFIVSLRPEDDRENIAKTLAYLSDKYGMEMALIEEEMPAINSTMIREMAGKGEDISALVLPEVREYIEMKGMYRG